MTDSEVPTLAVCDIRLTKLRCNFTDTEFTAEPYVWPVFFKVDGLTVAEIFMSAATARAKFVPRANRTSMVEVYPTASWISGARYGHGNIGGGMSAGQERNLAGISVHGIEPFTCRWGLLLPIPIFTDFGSGDRNLRGWAPGMVGCAVVVMEEDESPDSAAVAGFTAFRNALSTGLHGLVKNWSLTLEQYIASAGSGDTPEVVSAQAINAVKQDVTQAVKSAMRNDIVSRMSDWEKFKAWLGWGSDQDGPIGSGFWTWQTGEIYRPPSGPLAAAGEKTATLFGRRWRSTRKTPLYPLPRRTDWEIKGRVDTMTVPAGPPQVRTGTATTPIGPSG